MSDIFGLILAGGTARRMGGGDKGRREIGGASLFAHVIAGLSAQVDEMALSAQGDLTRFADLGLTVLEDAVPGGQGPLAGVLAGLAEAERRETSWLVSVPCDTPFFPGDLVARLHQAAMDQDTLLAMAASDGPDGRLQPVFGLWHVRLAAPLRAALERGVRSPERFAEGKPHGIAHWAEGAVDPFFNINTEADLTAGEQLWRLQQG